MSAGPMSDFSLEPTGITPPRPGAGSRPWKALTAVLAVVVAVLTFLLLRSHGLLGAEEDHSGARLGSLACGFLDGVDPEFLDGSKDDLTPTAERLVAARALATLAADEDPTYADLDETLQQMLGADVDFATVIEQGQGACADLADVAP